ncbi:exodeoxyribonuclease VII small subunit [Rothia amarae]|uniref:Exodeoxyribonuclease 7 small subunit n=1 Tax=Rothia amarae TaxID=169480 RepID=A0A7H2BLF0_9MICC|nr:exodeoxyribonuclease VII small subunit [Rothia amarae]QNV40496.1 exodeoxyribonuclease VII small subunit [Rothia amarae]SIK79822.1 exodeoxyribonuclease VII small subunit [Mycobacteroides abscessus subsp. abscessus]
MSDQNNTEHKRAAQNIEFSVSAQGAPVEELSYEQARAELMQVVSRMESGSSNLEETIALWERGEQLATRCEAWLDGARQRLTAAKEARSSSDTE